LCKFQVPDDDVVITSTAYGSGGAAEVKTVDRTRVADEAIDQFFVLYVPKPYLVVSGGC
jgi:hypothetical protein